MATDSLLSTAEAGQLLGVPQGTLRQWRHNAVGPPSFRVRHRVKYRLSALKKWLASQEAATTRGES